MTGATDIEKSTSIVPEFFFDLISRIIPGLFVIILIWHPEKLDKETFDLAIFSIFVFFAYGIGLILEVFIEFGFGVLLGLCNSLNSVPGLDSCSPLKKVISYLDDAKIWKDIRSKPSTEQIILKKFMAERGFCRTIFCLQLFFLLRATLCELKIELLGHEIHAYCFFYAAILAIIGFFRLGRAVTQILDPLSNNENNS
jgi:hypothetical protein